MTYIEFFDKSDVENICSCLTFVPDRVILVGDDKKKINTRIPYYQSVFSARGHQIHMEAKSISRSKLDLAVEQLNKIIETEDEIVFDITGGTELLLLALGIVYQQNPQKHIQIHWFNLKSNTIYDCDKDGKTVYHNAPQLSVEENIQIHGGDVVYGDVSAERTYRWDLTDDFLADVEKMWEICKANTHTWNIQMGIFAAINAVGGGEDDGLTVHTTVTAVTAYLDQIKTRLEYRNPYGLIDRLCDAGLLSCFEDDGCNITLSFKNHQVMRCLTKAGQILELKIYLTAMRAQNADGTPVYNDGLNGVSIDWDGDGWGGKDGKTANEIDVLLMHNVIPVFISCKNGYITADELYKLETVANHFGDEYAKKVLVATALSNLQDNGESIRSRAAAMGITVLDNVHTCTDDELLQTLASLWN